MARNKVMKLWNVVVTAFLALLTALGLIATSATTSATAAVPQTEPDRNSTARFTQTISPWAWSLAMSLPPTMKQRIRAEAHGKSPSCRPRPLTESESVATGPAADTTTATGARTDDCETEPPTASGPASIPLQR